jgi:hypothetical protein
MHLLPVNAHGGRGVDPQANPAPLARDHDDADLFANHDCFADTPTKDQHGFPSVSANRLRTLSKIRSRTLPS